MKAQSAHSARSSVYLELLGNAGIYSVNYDRLLSPTASGRIGVMLFSVNGRSPNGGNVTVTLVPVMVNYLKGNNHKFEVGVGPLFAFASGKFDEIGFEESGVGGTATIGYRYQPQKGGFNFRVGFTPIFASGGVLPLVGVSFGFGF